MKPTTWVVRRSETESYAIIGNGCPKLNLWFGLLPVRPGDGEG
jgi:hypothetical protein